MYVQTFSQPSIVILLWIIFEGIIYVGTHLPLEELRFHEQFELHSEFKRQWSHLTTCYATHVKYCD